MPKITIRRELCEDGLWDLPGGQKGTLADMLEYYISEHKGGPISPDELDKLRYQTKPGNPGNVTIRL